MTIPEQVDAYRALLDEKDRLAEETKANNRAIEAARDALRANGLGDLIKETVNAQSLQGAMSNLAEENDDELPEEFEGCVNVYSFNDITRRKSSRKQ